MLDLSSAATRREYEIPSSRAAVKQREAPLAMNRLDGCLPQLGPAAAEPLRVLANPVPALTCLVSTLRARHIESSLWKAVGEHRVNLMLLRLADVVAPAQLALGARRLGPEVVAQVSLLPLDAPTGGQLEALLRAAVRLHLVLGHARRGSISISRVWASSSRRGPSPLSLQPGV